MGGGGSKQQSQTVIENEIINETTKNIMNKTKNVSSYQVVSQQNMSLKGIKALSCKMPISQTTNLDVKVMQNFEASDSQKLVSEIMAGLDNHVKEKSSSESGFGDIMSGGSEKSDYTEVKTKIENKMKTNISNEFINEQAAKIVSGNNMVLEDVTFDPLFFELNAQLGNPLTLEERRLASQTDCPINQNMQITFVAEQIGKKVSEIINEEYNKSDLKSRLDKESTSKTQGAGEAVADAAEGIGAGVGGAAQGVGAGVGTAAQGVGSGVGTAAQGVGAGVGDAATGIGAGAAAAMSGPFIPFAVSSSSMMAAGMVMMMMSKGGGPDPAMMAALMKR